MVEWIYGGYMGAIGKIEGGYSEVSQKCSKRFRERHRAQIGFQRLRHTQRIAERLRELIKVQRSNL